MERCLDTPGDGTSGRDPLKLVVVTETYPPEINGVAMTINRLAEGLAARRHHVQVVRPRQGHDRRARSVRGAQGDGAIARLTHLLRPGLAIPRYAGLQMGWPSAATLLAQWRGQPPDVVHIATEGPLGWSALAAAQRLGIPVSSGFHTNFHDYSQHYGCAWLARGVAGYLRRFHNRTRCTLVPTEAQRGQLTEDGFRNVLTLARGVDAGLFSPQRRSRELRREWGIGDDGLALFLVGRMAAEKNIDLAIRAFAAVRAVRPRAVLVIAGDGPERLRLSAAHPEVRFTGVLDRHDLARHYASADLFVFPSMTETWGNVVAEAMASGVPVVGFAYAAAGRLVAHGGNGFLARFGDETEFIATTVAAAQRADLAAIGAAARNTSLELSWDTIISRFERILHHVARSRREPS